MDAEILTLVSSPAACDVRGVLGALDLLDGAQRHGRGFMVRCPAHGDRTPSCSIRLGPDGTLQVRCFVPSCDLRGGIFELTAAARGLNRDRDFPEVKRIVAAIAGVDIDRARAAPAPRRAPPPPRPKLMSEAEARAFWYACSPAASDPTVAAWLSARGLDLAAVAHLDLVRALPPDVESATWARYRGTAAAPRAWSALGYRAIVPVFDAAGDLRGVRARFVGEGTAPDGTKTLPPTGYSVRGLLMACPLGAMMLALRAWPWWAERVAVICEGEPDYLTRATTGSIPRTVATFGLGGSGAWTEDLAARFPDGSTVIIRTDPDDAGDRYAEIIAASLGARCNVLESEPDTRAERRRTRPQRDADVRRARAGQVTIAEVR